MCGGFYKNGRHEEIFVNSLIKYYDKSIKEAWFSRGLSVRYAKETTSVKDIRIESTLGYWSGKINPAVIKVDGFQESKWITSNKPIYLGLAYSNSYDNRGFAVVTVPIFKYKGLIDDFLYEKLGNVSSGNGRFPLILEECEGYLTSNFLYSANIKTSNLGALLTLKL